MGIVAETVAGKVEGFSKDGISVFLGIPFAAPPVGERRWLPPGPAKPWTGVRKTKAFAPMAPQNIMPPSPENPLAVGFSADISLGIQQDINEDCLYLNVFTPAIDSARRPVMFWIHGGGLQSGTGSSPLYNGAVLANRADVVVVSINYRLNVFGFLKLDEVTGGRIPATGNEGMLDQLAALEWVRDNIASFGGDPDNVTIFGESAGGTSVCNLMAMPRAKGLFHKAISQSGTANVLASREMANRYTDHFLEILEVSGDDVKTLRGLSVEKLLEALVKALPVPSDAKGPTGTIDGDIFPQMPIDAIAQGSADGIPLLAGTQSEESRLWQVFDPALEGLSEDSMFARFKVMMPDRDMKDTIKSYRKILADRGLPDTPMDTYLAVTSARQFWIPSLRLVEKHAGCGNQTFCYLLTWQSPFRDGIFGACHAMDLGFVWDAYKTDFYGPDPATEVIARGMQDAWLAFAHTGDPSCESLGRWPAYSEQRETMVFGRECGIKEAPMDEERRLWDTVPDNLLGW